MYKRKFKCYSFECNLEHKSHISCCLQGYNVPKDYFISFYLKCKAAHIGVCCANIYHKTREEIFASSNKWIGLQECREPERKNFYFILFYLHKVCTGATFWAEKSLCNVSITQSFQTEIFHNNSNQVNE